MITNEHPIPKDLRRRHLAVDFLQRHVRTETICEWTGLTRAHVKRLRQAHQHEFPSIKLRQFLRSARMRNEAAAAAGLCRAYNVIPAEPVPDAHRYLPSVARGEHVVQLYDVFCRLVPSATLSLEQLLFLLMSLATGEVHDLAPCSRCQAIILIDPLGAARRLCMHCAEEL